MQTVDFITLVNQFLFFWIGIPGFVLLYYYYKTRINEYLIWALMFIVTDIASVFDSIGASKPFSDPTWEYAYLFWVLYALFEHGALLLLYIHALRVKWQEPPKFLVYLGYVIFGYVFFMSFFQEFIPLSFGNIYTFLFFKVTPLFPEFHNWAVVTQGGIVLYDTGIFYQFDRPLICALLIYVYFTSDTVRDLQKDKMVKYLWILSFFLVGLSNILLMGDMLLIQNWPLGFQIFELIFYEAAIGFMIWPFIAIFRPEGLLLTHTQVSRAVRIQKNIKFDEKPVQRDIGIGHIKNYLDSIPEELKAELT